jgi:hypothetical protein
LSSFTRRGRSGGCGTDDCVDRVARGGSRGVSSGIGAGGALTAVRRTADGKRFRRRTFRSDETRSGARRIRGTTGFACSGSGSSRACS